MYTHTLSRCITRVHTAGNVNNGRERGGASSLANFTHLRRRWTPLERATMGVQGDEPGPRTGSCNRYRRTAVHREYGDFHELSRTRARLPSTNVHHSPPHRTKRLPHLRRSRSSPPLPSTHSSLSSSSHHFYRACALVDCGAIPLGAKFKCRISFSTLYICIFVL